MSIMLLLVKLGKDYCRKQNPKCEICPWRLIKTPDQKLFKINLFDSQNPPGDESKIADFVGKYLKALGLKVKTYTFQE